MADEHKTWFDVIKKDHDASEQGVTHPVDYWEMFRLMLLVEMLKTRVGEDVFDELVEQCEYPLP